MYLLIPADRVPYCRDNIHLHPTMYLLIPFICHNFNSPFLYLHPTMYLLIRKLHMFFIAVYIFTSHYVSINSIYRQSLEIQWNNLHPTMYLLILFRCVQISAVLPDLHPTMYLLIPFCLNKPLKM